MRICFLVSDVRTQQATYGGIYLAWAAHRRGHDVRFVSVDDLSFLDDNSVLATTLRVRAGDYPRPADYLTALGVLNWASGDGAPKTFQVTIVDDGVDEPNETFNVTISNVQGGAALGSPTTEVVTIVDDDVINPIEVPTLGDFGKLLLAALFGAGGVRLLRRRRENGAA